ALLERAGERGTLAWLYFNNAGTLQDTRGADDEARVLYGRALAALEQLGDEDRIEAVFTHSNLAQLEAEHHRFAEGIAAQREALAAAERLYGPRHPMSATLLYILANMLSEADLLAEARTQGERALALEVELHGEDSPALAPHLALLAKLANRRGDYEEAATLASRGLAVLDEPDFFTVRLRHILGEARIGQGRVAEGVASHRAALALARERFPADNFRFLEADINALDRLELGTFDLVLSIGTLHSPGIDDRAVLRQLFKHHLEPRAGLIFGFPNCTYRDGELRYGAKMKNFRQPELSLLIKQVGFYKKYLQQHRRKVFVTGKHYLLVTGAAE
ncbi:MAG: tetratricopeptide repeat protein, partial [Myxococcales bacterium]|nr:tetratricopeptide repeat protein [Myxococcales bacterium]